MVQIKKTHSRKVLAKGSAMYLSKDNITNGMTFHVPMVDDKSDDQTFMQVILDWRDVERLIQLYKST